MSKKLKRSSLPPPTVKYVTDSSEISEAALQGMMSNPVYVGVPPYRRAVSDEAWVRAAAKLIEQQGAEQFLVNMLYMLRVSMVDAVPDEAVPEDYDGPWPDDEEEVEEPTWTEDEAVLVWHNPVEGSVFCSHDDLPMIVIDDQFVCVGEYLYAHIADAPVNDLVSEPILTLVFQNGHTLPLLCPDCGKSLHAGDHGELLDNLNGLTIVEVEWDAENEELLIGFGRPGLYDEEEPEILEMLNLHLDSVRTLTCPHQKAWHDDEEEE